MPLRGCLNPDANHYSVSYVSQQSGRCEECFDERVTLRELKPVRFPSLPFALKFSLRKKELAHQMFKRQVGKLIGKNLAEFDDLQNCEVNDFRWRMKVFANKIAQERKGRLEKSISDQIQYQYPPLMARKGDHGFGETVRVRILWDDASEDVTIAAGASPTEVLRDLGERLGRDSDGRFLKVTSKFDRWDPLGYSHCRIKM